MRLWPEPLRELAPARALPEAPAGPSGRPLQVAGRIEGDYGYAPLMASILLAVRFLAAGSLAVAAAAPALSALAAPARGGAAEGGAAGGSSAGGGSARAAAKLPELEALAIADKVQAFYERAKSYQAEFTQRYTIFAYNKKKESRGRVAFVKPGKMSFRYEGSGNRVVSDGKVLKVYEAENKQLFRQQVTESAYPAALSFLLGQGKLRESFELKKLSSQTLKFQGGYVLLALPLQPSPAYEKMLLYIDGKTFQVRRVLLIDAQKNKNVFDFSKPVVNRPVSPGEFVFKPPAGTQIIDS